MKLIGMYCRVVAFLGVVALLGLGLRVAGGAEAGDQVVVVYNSAMPESKAVADYYVAMRQVPASQVFGFKLPADESISRMAYTRDLEQPLLKALQKEKLLVLGGSRALTGVQSALNLRCRVESATFRYVVLCYGVPTRIVADPNLKEATAGLQPELVRNEASVDSELACLPLQDYLRAGPLPNPFYGATNAAFLHPTNGVLMVGRVDGPDVRIAQGLVDRAMMAETNGLWGRAYFDARGLKEGGYLQGDKWILGAAEVCRRLGFTTEVDNNPETLTAAFPLSHAAFYAGWYDEKVSGPFTRDIVEFMPGALAYHLHSFSAHTIRSRTERWVGPLLAKGATATMGSVDEPYLRGTPDVAVLFDRFINGKFSFGEAATVAETALSWQIIAVGDPLYRPFTKPPAEIHQELVERQSPLVAWSHLRVVNLALVRNMSLADTSGYLSSIPGRRASPALMEKMADIYLAENSITDAISTYEGALQARPSGQQKVRLLLTIAAVAEKYGRLQKALDTYVLFLTEVKDYPDKVGIYRKMLPLATSLGNKDLMETSKREIARLSGPQP